MATIDHKFGTSPIDHGSVPPPPVSGKQLDMWDLRLAQEGKHSSSVTPTTATADGGAHHSRTPQSSQQPPQQQQHQQGGGDVNVLEMLGTALRSSPAALKQMKFEIARLVLARNGSSAKPTEEEANAIIEVLAKELGPMGFGNSETPPMDGRMTIDSELQWSNGKDGDTTNVAVAESVHRPNAPVNDAPQHIPSNTSTGVLENTNFRGGLNHSRVYSTDSNTSTQPPIRPKPQVLLHANKAFFEKIKRHGGLKNHSSRTSAFSEHSDVSFGSRTGSSISKDNRAE